MNDIDTIVQGILTDSRLTPEERAKEATLHIDRFVREEDDIPVNLPLPIPPEWEHRVPQQVIVTVENVVTEAPKKGWFRR